MTLEEARSFADGRTASDQDLVRALLVVGLALLERFPDAPVAVPTTSLPPPESSPKKTRTRRRKKAA